MGQPALQVMYGMESLVGLAKEGMGYARPFQKTAPCVEGEIARKSAEFRDAFGHFLPEAYWRVMRLTNGILYNGLEVWPVRPHELFEETVIEANERLREESTDFLYYGRMDGDLYALDLRSGRYCAIESTSKRVWKIFDDDEQMFVDMLERAM